MTTLCRYALVALVVFLAALHSSEACAGKKIGVFLYSSEIRYVDAFRGFKDGMKLEGFGEPETTYLLENANGNKATAAGLVTKFAKSNMDLYFTAGTSATILLSKNITDKPVVFSAVYDPVKSGIARSWRSSGNNTTGTSTIIPMSILLDTLKLLKDVKRLAVLYNPGELNSEYVLRDLMDLQQSWGLKVLPVPTTKKEDVIAVLPEVMRTSDAVYVTGSNLVNSQLTYIMEMAAKYRTVTITHLDDLVEKGVLLGVTSSSYQIGFQAGEKAAKILKGAKPASLPIETVKRPVIVLNQRSAQAAQIQIPDKLAKIIDRKIK